MNFGSLGIWQVQNKLKSVRWTLIYYMSWLPGCKWTVWACSWDTEVSVGVQRTLWQREWAAEWRYRSPPAGIRSPVGEKQASRCRSGESRVVFGTNDLSVRRRSRLWTDLENWEWAEFLMTHSASSFKCPCVGDVVTQVVDLELENVFFLFFFKEQSDWFYTTQQHL